MYRPFHCPVVGCSFEVYTLLITPHFQKKHGGKVFILEPDIDDGNLLLEVDGNIGPPVYVIVQGCKESDTFLLHHRFDQVLCNFSFFYSFFGPCSQFYRFLVTVDRQGIKHGYSIEAPVSDNQFGKDWLAKMEQRSNFLGVYHYDNPALINKSTIEMDLELL